MSSESETYYCPMCGFEQDELCVIGDNGLNYACDNDECRVSTFLGEDDQP